LTGRGALLTSPSMSAPPTPPPPPGASGPSNPREADALEASARVRDARTGEATEAEMQRIRSTPTRESVETAAPIAQVRADVARFRRFAQSIHSRYVQGGLLVYLVAATSGT